MLQWILSIFLNLAFAAFIAWSVYRVFTMRKERDQTLKTFAQLHDLTFTPPTWLHYCSVTGIVNNYPILIEPRRMPGRGSSQYLYVALTTQQKVTTPIHTSPGKTDATLPAELRIQLDAISGARDTKLSLEESTASIAMHYHTPTMNDIEQITTLLTSIARTVDKGQIQP